MIDTPEVFRLSTGERQSIAWIRLLAHLNDKLAIVRSKNDGPHDATTTANLRGQIAAYKALIDLDKDLPVID